MKLTLEVHEIIFLIFLSTVMGSVSILMIFKTPLDAIDTIYGTLRWTLVFLVYGLFIALIIRGNNG